MIAFDHENLRAYREAIAFIAWMHVEKVLAGAGAALKDQLHRASVSIPLDIAEGNGKSFPRDRARYLESARGSALECAACLDVAVAIQALDATKAAAGKEQLMAIVRMLSGHIRSTRGDCVNEEEAGYGAALPE